MGLSPLRRARAHPLPGAGGLAVRTAATVVAAVLGTAGCASPIEIAHRPVRLGPQWTVLASDVLEATGPDSHLCVLLPADTEVGSAGRVRRASGAAVAVSARLITPAGDSVALGPPGLSMGGDVQYCFGGYGRISQGQRWRAAALWADDTVTVRAVTWESGHRWKL